MQTGMLGIGLPDSVSATGMSFDLFGESFKMLTEALGDL
jgi:hypothetical protein